MGQSIQRAINLVRRSAEHPLTLTEAADVLGVHKSTALRILQTLENARFVRKTGAGTYVLGSGLIELSELALGSMDLRQFAATHLAQLQRQTGHTVHLAQLTGDEIIYKANTGGMVEVFNIRLLRFSNEGVGYLSRLDQRYSEWGGSIEFCSDEQFYCLAGGINVAVPRHLDKSQW